MPPQYAPDDVIEAVAYDPDRHRELARPAYESMERRIDGHAVELLLELVLIDVQQLHLPAHALERSDLPLAPTLFQQFPARQGVILKQSVDHVVEGNRAVKVAGYAPVSGLERGAKSAVHGS